MVCGRFVERRRQMLLYSLLAKDSNKKDQKNLRGKLVDYCPKQNDHMNEP